MKKKYMMLQRKYYKRKSNKKNETMITLSTGLKNLSIDFKIKHRVRPVIRRTTSDIFNRSLAIVLDSGKVNNHVPCQYPIRCPFHAAGFLRSSFAEIKRHDSTRRTGNTSSSLAWIPAGISGISGQAGSRDAVRTHHSPYMRTYIVCTTGKQTDFVCHRAS